MQMSLGYGPGHGNVQLFTTKLGQSSGNCRINVGSQQAVKAARDSLLRSAWFHDAIPGSVSPFGHKPEAIFQPEGKAILPALPASTGHKDLERFLKGIKKKLGGVGIDAIREYLTHCGIPQDSEIGNLITKVFGSKGGSDRVPRPKAGSE